MAISYGVSLARATTLLTVTAGLLTLANVATSQVTDPARPMTVDGCLVTERDYAAARGLARPIESADAQLVIVLAKDASRSSRMDGIALTGRQEAALARDAGRQITLDGVLEPPLTASPAFTAREPDDSTTTSTSPSGAVGTTPAGSPAHEPSDAASLAGTVADPAGSREAALRARPASVADLSRLNVTASRNAGERCELEIVPKTAASQGVAGASGVQQNAAAGAVPAAPRASTPDAGTPITVIGCLVREDMPDGSGASYLAVVGAVTGAGTARVQGSAVPGSFPSGTGSGTIGTTGTSANVQPWAFRLITSDPTVARRVGQRVEVVGTAERADAGVNDTRTTTTAHTTAPTRQIRVTSVRAASGSCQ
jgi:hypothetical protein